MCELLGLAFNRPVSPGLSFRGFRHRAVTNPDGRRKGNPHGWGIAAITPRGATIRKEAENAMKSEQALTLPERDPLHAPIFIAHVRAASEGGQAASNTHPFSRPLDRGDLVLAHNGTIHEMRELRRLPGDGFTPAGQTDSELILGAILGWVDRGRRARAFRPGTVGPGDRPDARRPDPLGDFAALEEFLREVNELGEMNLLFSDGRRLFCYFDHGSYHGLVWTRRRAPFQRVSLRDEDWTAELGEEKAWGQRGYVIATSPLTEGETWHSFAPGRLVVFEGGDAVFGLSPTGEAGA